MRPKVSELWLSVVAMLFITMVYLFVTVIQGGIPEPGSFFGVALGISGFVLMLVAEIAYSFRKRSRSVRWGRIASWFDLHVFAGLVGPFLVLLHTGWKFDGIAGVSALLTALIVISGIGGRYIYTAIPRTADGVALEKDEIEQRIRDIEAQLEAFLADHPTIPAELYRRMESLPDPSVKSARLMLGRSLRESSKRIARWMSNRQLGAREKAQVHWLDQLIDQRDTLRRQLASLAFTRGLLGYWYFLHIPIGLGMFVLVIIHIITAVYFSNPV